MHDPRGNGFRALAQRKREKRRKEQYPLITHALQDGPKTSYELRSLFPLLTRSAFSYLLNLYVKEHPQCHLAKLTNHICRRYSISELIGNLTFYKTGYILYRDDRTLIPFLAEHLPFPASRTHRHNQTMILTSCLGKELVCKLHQYWGLRVTIYSNY